ncbi:MAG: hypothetical protein EP338_03850 [Bacteroidetes bacterium]|nr:MAG: hypothetical protein EP338_03850 [Bacteroidota bacterium]
MKKLLFGLIATVALSLSVQAQSNDIEGRAIHRAEAAARPCLENLNLPSNYELVSYATLNLYCDVFTRPNPNYAGFKVEVYAKPNCPPNQACIQVIYHVATVYVDCQGSAYQVDCAGPIVIAQ